MKLVGTGRPWGVALITLALTAGVGVVIWSPLLMYHVLGHSLPWATLANVGEAYGGASALLSAAALCGIGASLFLQVRQVRQELTSLDKQRHFDLIKLALDNPEFFEVMDGSPLEEPDGRRKIGANLTLNYWLAMWELGEVAEPELRALTTNMFRSRISRAWWGEVNQSWITVRGRRRRQFLRIVHEEWMSAGADAVEPPPVLEVAATGSGKRHGTVMLWCTAASIVAGTIVTATRRRRRHATGG